MDPNESSPTRTESTSTLVFSRAPSRGSSSVTTYSTQPFPQLPAIPSGPLPVTALSVTAWRPEYPRIGQFATTDSEEVVAAGPNGLFYFKRVRDHTSTPWSEPRPLPTIPALLNDSSVSGVAVHRCLRWSLVVPCQSGGLLHTAATYYLTNGHRSSEEKTKWTEVDHIAKDLGVISAVSIAARDKKDRNDRCQTNIVAVCIARAQLHTLEGEFSIDARSSSNSLNWKAQASARIHHPGEVTGNPIVIWEPDKKQLDLLVPSAEGGVFHFVQPRSSPDEWHMIARITFPHGIPIASCLAVNDTPCEWQRPRQFTALVQSGGRLYQVKTNESAAPWTRSHLKPIEGPGPFSD
ncbi:hypothetical protein O1611_g6475 [Lasiodiplodia mahajangana]|uniref:Uncharacterized protein n=1 Tax=Lasiodiplodia mahajangana TaxID=1108764 RepID=A0ACC2JI26_9PEZI|nr:hypothetical protein O1611_g6475 [Lasiodiplodia mahajangana]